MVRNVVWTYLALDEHEEALEAAQKFRETYGDDWETLGWEALALAVLGRVEEADALHDDLTALPEQGLNQGWMILHTAAYLRRLGQTDVAQSTVNRAIQWHEARVPETKSSAEWRWAYAVALYVADRCDEAYSVATSLSEESPEDLSRRGLVGILAACRADPEEAQQISRWLEALGRPYLRGSHMGWRSLISGALSDGETAVVLWSQAVSQGHYAQPWAWIWTVFEPIRDYPPFQELMRPKG